MPNKFITACHSSDKSSDMVVEDMNAYDTRDKLETKTNFTQLNKEQAVSAQLILFVNLKTLIIDHS
jgi:hypothetical protein